MKELDNENPRRMFMGKTREGDLTIQMNDSIGRERIRIGIDKEDNPKIEILNDEGEVIYQLPPEI